MKIKLGELRKIVKQICEASDFSKDPDFAKITNTKRPISDEERAAFKKEEDKLEWEEVFSEYSDVYKEKNNIRPRWLTPETTPLEKLKQMLEDLYNELPAANDDW